ncbi:MAG: hypothetical protein AVDCRST_MAG10-381, partial [uncultured Acidimicrobiales bacterium]
DRVPVQARACRRPVRIDHAPRHADARRTGAAPPAARPGRDPAGQPSLPVLDLPHRGQDGPGHRGAAHAAPALSGGHGPGGAVVRV